MEREGKRGPNGGGGGGRYCSFLPDGRSRQSSEAARPDAASSEEMIDFSGKEISQTREKV